MGRGEHRLSLLAKSLILLGAVLILLGIVFLVAPRLPWIGRLPGDIHIERRSFAVYFPLTTCIIITVMLIGRLGPLTLLAALTFNLKPARYNYPDESLIVG